MVRSIISMVVVAALLFVGSFFESKFVNSNFESFHEVLSVLYEKVDNQTAVQEDVYTVQKNWLDKKQYLHAFIPHNDIKEIDLWIAESATLVRDKEWKDAISKVEVLLELCEQIPRTFALRIENVL